MNIATRKKKRRKQHRSIKNGKRLNNTIKFKKTKFVRFYKKCEWDTILLWEENGSRIRSKKKFNYTLFIKDASKTERQNKNERMDKDVPERN